MPKNILIVDDEKDLLELAKRKLERSGYKVLTAENGEQGLEIVNNKNLDLIVTDIVMPIMDGYTFFKEVKKSKGAKNIPVIVLTARSSMEDSFRALGADEFLAKPFNANELL